MGKLMEDIVIGEWGCAFDRGFGRKFGGGGGTRVKDKKKFHIGGTVSHVNRDSEKPHRG